MSMWLAGGGCTDSLYSFGWSWVYTAPVRTDSIAKALPTIFAELVLGSPDPSARTFVLNQGDRGLLESLDRLTAAEASAIHGDGASIAAHVDHLRYGFSLLNRWAEG